MTEALVMTRNLFGTNSLETALGRLHIGIAYRSLYEDTALSMDQLLDLRFLNYQFCPIYLNLNDIIVTSFYDTKPFMKIE